MPAGGLPSDHPSLSTLDATVERRGRTSRPKLTLPTNHGLDVAVGDVVRVVLDGSDRHARLAESTTGGDHEFCGVFDTPAEARSGDGPDRLADWVDARDLDFGRTVHVDVLETGFRYGLRAPGERVVYERTGAPDDSLASIAAEAQERSSGSERDER